MSQSRIIMNFTFSPSLEDLDAIAQEIIQTLPEEIAQHCEKLITVIDDMADEALEQELELNDPFELMALFRSGKEISPGVMRKIANDDDVLILFRRPILDMWCDTGDHLEAILREVIILELGRHFDFSEDEIDVMVKDHYQGAL